MLTDISLTTSSRDEASLLLLELLRLLEFPQHTLAFVVVYQLSSIDTQNERDLASFLRALAAVNETDADAADGGEDDDAPSPSRWNINHVDSKKSAVCVAITQLAVVSAKKKPSFTLAYDKTKHVYTLSATNPSEEVIAALATVVRGFVADDDDDDDSGMPDSVLVTPIHADEGDDDAS